MIFPSDDAIRRGTVTRYSPGVLLGNWYEEMRQKEDKLKLFQQNREEAARQRRIGGDGCLHGSSMEEAVLLQRLVEPVDICALLASLPKEEWENNEMEEHGGLAAHVRQEYMAKGEVLADGIYRPEYCYTSWAPMPSPSREGIVSNYPPELPMREAVGGGCRPTGVTRYGGEEAREEGLNGAPLPSQRLLRQCCSRPTNPREGPPPCVAPRGPRVPLGVPLMIRSVKTGAALALDCTARPGQGPYDALVTASPSTVPVVRTTWTIFPCLDENNMAYRSDWMGEGRILHYGQRVRIGNENITEMGTYCLQGDLENGYQSSVPRKVKASMGACADSVFMVGRPAHRRGDPTSDGYPVRMGDPITLIHVASNQPLCCMGEDARRDGGRGRGQLVSPVHVTTRFGVEYAVNCMLERNGRFGVSRADVVVLPENMFFFATGSEADGPRTKSQQNSVCLDQILPMSCGDGLDRIIGEIRAGAIKMGGRLGLRPLSLALGTAGAEGRYPFFLDRPGLVERFTKLGIYLLPGQLDAMMSALDHTGNHTVNALELMSLLRAGTMNPYRMKAVVTAFQRLLMEGKGGVEFTDMFHLYCENSHGHPDVMDGLISRAEACKDFEVCWPSHIINTKLGTVRLDEFTTYYADISPAVYDDRRFCATLRNCWMIPLTDAYRKGIPFRVIEVEHNNGEKKSVRVPNTMVLNPENRDGILRMLYQHGLTDIKDFSVSNLI